MSKKEVYRVVTSVKVCGWVEIIDPIVFYFDVKDMWYYGS